MNTKSKTLNISLKILIVAVLIHYLYWSSFYISSFSLQNTPNDFLIFFVLIISGVLILADYFFSAAILIFMFSHIYFLANYSISYGGWAYSLPIFLILHLAMRAKVIPSAARLIFLAYLSLLYFVANINRFKISEWTEGRYIYEVLQNPLYSRFSSTFVESLEPYLNTKLVTHSTVLIELLGCLLFFTVNNKLRRTFVIALLALHTGILILMKVEIWSPVMLSCVLVAWDPLPKLDWKSIRVRIAVATGIALYSILIVTIVQRHALYKRGVIYDYVLYSISRAAVFQIGFNRVGLEYTLRGNHGEQTEAIYRNTEDVKNSPIYFTDKTDKVVAHSVLFNYGKELNPSWCGLFDKIFEKKMDSYIIELQWHFKTKIGPVNSKVLDCKAR